MNAGPGGPTGRAGGPDGTAAARRRGSGELSRLVLGVLREAGRALTPAEVQAQLAAAGAGRLAHTTVVTTLSRLHTLLGPGLSSRRRAGQPGD